MQWNEFRSHVRHLSARDLERVQAAFELGKKVHGDQKRRSGEPYFTHPIAVADMLADMGADADTIIAALLHDTVEDTPLTLAELDAQFKGTVASLIDGVTKLYSNLEKPTLDGQIETLRKIFTLMQQDVRIMVIKLVDRLHNMQTAEFLSLEKQKALAKETMEVYVKIADRLCMQDLRDELEGLCLAILEPEIHKNLSKLRSQNEKKGIVAIKSIRETLHKKYPNDPIEAEYEFKTWQALRAQLESGGTTTGVSQFTAIFICESTEECYEALGKLHQSWLRETLSFQDFINSPMINGYKGLHTTIILEDGTRIRCKIRTKEMHAYARRGIATRCFDSEAMGLLDYLPWTQRISPLTNDTAEKSELFWQSLQSDILGDSIVIHGPAGEPILLPSNSTALDGAFYCIESAALRCHSILLDGKEAAFNSPLRHGMSVTIHISKDLAVSREWLNWVRTGFAIAKIRNSLARQSDELKLAQGKEMLEKIMQQNKRGYIEEFDDKGFDGKMLTIGYNSLSDAYVAIADGHLEPIEVYNAIFAKKERPTSKEREITVRFVFHLENTDSVSELLRIYSKYKSNHRLIRFRFNPFKKKSTPTVKLSFTPAMLEQYIYDLRSAGATEVEIIPNNSLWRQWLMLGSLVALWGLDPVFAHFLLQTDLSAYDLTILRAWTFFIAATSIFLGQRIFSAQKYKPVPIGRPSLYLSGVALFITALFSYLALKHITASLYILLIITGLILSSLLQNGFAKNPVDWKLIVAFLLGIGSIAAATPMLDFTIMGIVFGIISSAGFAAYSLVSNRYQQEAAMINARYPAFIFILSVVGLILSFSILPFGSISQLTLPTIISAITFVLIFSVAPYSLYYECMKKMDQKYLDRSLPFVAIFAFVGEAIITKSIIGLTILPLIGLIFFFYMSQRIIPKSS